MVKKGMMNMATKFSKVFKEALEKITYRHWIMLAGAARDASPAMPPAVS